MSQLTPQESLLFQRLANKAGIRIPTTKKALVPLSRKEIKRIELAVQRSAGDPVVLIRKRSSVRVLSLDTYKSWVKNGHRVGAHKNKGVVNVQSSSN